MKPTLELSWRCTVQYNTKPEAAVATHCHEQVSKQLHSDQPEQIPSFCADAGRQPERLRAMNSQGNGLRRPRSGSSVVSHRQMQSEVHPSPSFLSSCSAVLFPLSPAWAPLTHQPKAPQAKFGKTWKDTQTGRRS